MLDSALKRRFTITATGYNNSETALDSAPGQIPALRVESRWKTTKKCGQDAAKKLSRGPRDFGRLAIFLEVRGLYAD